MKLLPMRKIKFNLLLIPVFIFSCERPVDGEFSAFLLNKYSGQAYGIKKIPILYL